MTARGGDRVVVTAEIVDRASRGAKQVRSSISGIKTEARQASFAMSAINKRIDDSVLAFKRGEITQEQYRAAIRHSAIETQRLGQNTQQLQARIGGLERLVLGRKVTGPLTTGFREAGRAAQTTAREGLGTIRSSLASLTATTVGASGTMGTLSGAMLQFAAGNAIAVGVIAGIAAIAFGFKSLGRAAREAREEANKARDALRQLKADESLPAGADDLFEQKKALQTQRAGILTVEAAERLEGFFAEFPDKRVPQSLRQYRALTAQIMEFEQRIQKLFEDSAVKQTEQTARVGEQRRAERATEIAQLLEANKLTDLSIKQRDRLLELERQLNAELEAGTLSLGQQNENRRLLNRVTPVADHLDPNLLRRRQFADMRMPETSASQAFISAQQAAVAESLKIPNSAANIRRGMGTQALSDLTRATDVFEKFEQSMRDQEKAAQEAAKETEKQARASEQAARAARHHAIATAHLITSIGSALEGAIQSLRSGGGPGAFLKTIGGLGGTLSLIPGLQALAVPSALAMAGGGIISGLTSRTDDREIPVRVTRFDDQAASLLIDARDIELQVINQIINETGDIREVAHKLIRLDKRDGLNRTLGLDF